MARQYSMVESFPRIKLLANAADAAGRTSALYASLRNCEKAWVVVEVNQGNAATVLISLLQGTSDAGAGSKAIQNATRIWLNNDTSLATGSDAYTAQTAGTTFTTDATTKDKLVVFEIVPENVLDMANGFNHIGVSTGASNAANITSADIHIWGSYQAATPPTSYA